MQKDSVYLAGGKPESADASPANGIVPVAVRDALIAAWKSGYYHHGYTNDSAYADQEGAKIADELIADQLNAQPVMAQDFTYDQLEQKVVDILAENEQLSHSNKILQERLSAQDSGKVAALQTVEPKCPCAQCRPITLEDMRMILCPTCGNKRCPKASDHTFACTGSNEPGQPGSVYA